MLLGEFERIIGPDRVPALASHSNSENDPRQDPAGIGARAVADAEAPRAPTRREKASGSLTVKTESRPPMTLGNAARARVRLIGAKQDPCGAGGTIV